MAKPPVKPGMGDPANPAGNNKEAMVQRFLEIQSEEIKLRKQELEIRAQESKHNASYAEKALEAQAADRIDGRKHETRMARDRLIFAAIVIVLVIVLSVVALVFDQADLVKMLVQTLSSLFIGMFGGFFWGRSSERRKSSQGGGSDPE